MKFLVPRAGDKKGDKVFPSKQTLEPSVTSVAEVLKSSGYRTAHFGKWHLGQDGQGFDINDTNGLGADLKKKLYDLESDPGESKNLAESNKAMTSTLLSELRQWQKDTKAVIPTEPNPDFDPKAKRKRK